MRIRVESFIDAHLVQLMHEVHEDKSVAVVAHGIILSHLWRAILKRFHPFVTVASGVQATGPGMSLEYLGGWSNTGYLDLEVKKRARLSNGNVEPDVAATFAMAPSTSKIGTAPDPVLPDGSVAEVINSQGSFTPPQKPATRSFVPVDPSLASSPSPGLKELHLVVKAVNSQEHLKGLKKTRGGIGSLKHDSSQKTVDSFFKKRKREHESENDGGP